MANKSYVSGQRVIIRDAEWIIKKVEILADDGYELRGELYSGD